MTAISNPTVTTADQLANLSDDGQRRELLNGVLRMMSPAGGRHGKVVFELGRLIGNHVAALKLGAVFAAETGFMLSRDPDTVRAPDVAFISRDRLPDPAPRGFAELAPDLADEVLSPDDRPGVVLAKVADWLKAGSRLVWVVDPQRARARVYRADGSEALLAEFDALDGEDVLPGFSCSLGTIYA